MTSYVQSSLRPGEQVITHGRVHWSIHLPGVIHLILGGLLISASLRLPGQLMLLAGTLLLLQSVVFAATTELAITNRRVIATMGLFRRSRIELQHDRIDAFEIDQDFLARLLNYGTVVVSGAGIRFAPIRAIAAPQVIKQFCREVLPTPHFPNTGSALRSR